MEYKLIVGSVNAGPEAFSGIVNSYIKQGWRISGSLTIVHYHGLGDHFVQAMTFTPNTGTKHGTEVGQPLE